MGNDSTRQDFNELADFVESLRGASDEQAIAALQRWRDGEITLPCPETIRTASPDPVEVEQIGPVTPDDAPEHIEEQSIREGWADGWNDRCRAQHSAHHVPNERGMNRFGLNVGYFRTLINRELNRSLENYRPDELARVLARAARTADAAVLNEAEFGGSPALKDVHAERERQTLGEGWEPCQDDTYTDAELAVAGGIYSMHAAACLQVNPEALRWPQGQAPRHWPFDPSWFKPKGPRRDLVRAGALIVAEIERIDRADGSRRGAGTDNKAPDTAQASLA